MTEEDVMRVQQYMRTKFNNNKINFDMSTRKSDSIEVKLGEEFIGVLYKDVEDGETSFSFNMAILEMDLNAMAA